MAQLTTDEPDSTDPDYLAWVEQRIAEGRKQLNDPSKRIPAADVWTAFDLEY